jgi:DNA-binding SARP family transcriptional activator
MSEPSASEKPVAGRHLEIGVLGGFRFWVRGKDALPALAGSSQRLLAFLALRDRSVTRAAVAGTSWPEASENHAHASLRSAISRLTQIAHEANCRLCPRCKPG